MILFELRIFAAVAKSALVGRRVIGALANEPVSGESGELHVWPSLQEKYIETG